MGSQHQTGKWTQSLVPNQEATSNRKPLTKIKPTLFSRQRSTDCGLKLAFLSTAAPCFFMRQKTHYHGILSTQFYYITHPYLKMSPRIHASPSCLLHPHGAHSTLTSAVTSVSSECITLLTSTKSPARSRQACMVLCFTELAALGGLLPSAASQP